MAFSKNHGSKRSLNLIMHIMVIRYGEKAEKICFNRSDKMEMSKSDIFLSHPLDRVFRLGIRIGDWLGFGIKDLGIVWGIGD